MSGSSLGDTHRTTDNGHRDNRQLEQPNRARQAERCLRARALTWLHGSHAPQALRYAAPGQLQTERRDGSNRFPAWASKRLPTAARASGTAGSKGKSVAFRNHKPSTSKLGGASSNDRSGTALRQRCASVHAHRRWSKTVARCAPMHRAWSGGSGGATKRGRVAQRLAS